MPNAWNIDAVHAREAMAQVAPLLGPGNDWAGVVIAHLDTGYTDHEVFNLESDAPAILTLYGKNYMEGDPARPLDPLDYDGPLELRGHGTKTLGLLCGNREGGFVGVCPGVPVIPYRVTNGVVLTGGRIDNLARAIRHAVDNNGAKVISISLGVDGLFENARLHPLGRAVDHAYENGVIICCAAGQTESAPAILGSTVYPGRYSRTIMVGGINEDLEICFDYNTGREFIDIWAPAANVLRPEVVPGGAMPFTAIGAGDGTSFATVHAAAAAAMWLRVRGQELDDGGYDGWQRVEAFREALRSSFLPLAGNDTFPAKPTPDHRGILDCARLLGTKLADLDDLEKQTLAEPEVG